jgi:hypothetical protein
MIRIGIATLAATLSTLGLTSLAKHQPPVIAESEANQDVRAKLHRYTLPGGTAEEQRVLEYFQDRGITDKAALAVLLGNIQQESKFNTRICEGGQNTGYHGCHRGGFGLIQWTTPGRYAGLQRYARNNKCDIHSLECQLGYLTHEIEWRKVEHRFKATGNSISGYMSAARRWLGWGVHGARTTYATQYYNRLTK